MTITTPVVGNILKEMTP